MNPKDSFLGMANSLFIDTHIAVEKVNPGSI